MCKLFQKFGSRFWDTTDFLAWKKISACNTWINRLICKIPFPVTGSSKSCKLEILQKTELWQKKAELLPKNNFLAKKTPELLQKN